MLSAQATPAFPVAFLFLVVASCSAGNSERDGIPAFSIRDSAGIKIIENSASAWTSETAWIVDPEPFLTIGSR